MKWESIPEAKRQAAVTIIDFQVPTHRCAICGEWDLSKWGVPVDSMTGEIVANDFDGDWGGVPACEVCHEKHAAGAFVGTYPRF